MPTLRDGLLPLVALEGRLGTAFGVRRDVVTIRVRTWPTGVVGVGTPTNTDRVLDPRPEVRALSAREVASSGGTYSEGDLRIENIPAAFAGGGNTPAQLDPTAGPNQDVVVLVAGDAGTRVCTTVARHFDDPFEYALTVRPTRETP